METICSALCIEVASIMPHFQREILPRDTATNKQRITPRPIRILHRRLIEDVSRIERASGPSNITKVYVAVVVQERNLLAQVLHAGCDVAATSLGEDGHCLLYTSPSPRD